MFLTAFPALQMLYTPLLLKPRQALPLNLPQHLPINDHHVNSHFVNHLLHLIHGVYTAKSVTDLVDFERSPVTFSAMLKDIYRFALKLYNTSAPTVTTLPSISRWHKPRTSYRSWRTPTFLFLLRRIPSTHVQPIHLHGPARNYCGAIKVRHNY